MSTKKKVVIVLLSLLASAFLITGCDSEGTPRAEITTDYVVEVRASGRGGYCAFGRENYTTHEPMCQLSGDSLVCSSMGGLYYNWGDFQLAPSAVYSLEACSVSVRKELHSFVLDGEELLSYQTLMSEYEATLETLDPSFVPFSSLQP